MTRPAVRSHRPAMEIADIFRRHGDAYRHAHAGHLGRVERRVMSAIVACRTEALGGHVEACNDCGMTRIAYNSCRNRHCPKCQGQPEPRGSTREKPTCCRFPISTSSLRFLRRLPRSFQNKAVVYAILFKAAAEAMTTLAANPRQLGAEMAASRSCTPGDRALTHHPHVHCVVPGGGLSPDGTRWVASRPGLLPGRQSAVPALSLAFSQTPDRGPSTPAALSFFGDLASLAELDAFAGRIKPCTRQLGCLRQAALRRTRTGPGLSRPLHPSRRDRQQPAHRTRRRSCRLLMEGLSPKQRDKDHEAPPDEFIRRFLLHTLPDGFHRIRHFGFMANRHRAAKLALCRELLDHVRAAPNDGRPALDSEAQTWAEVPACPDCSGVMRIIERFRHSFSGAGPQASPFRCDTS